MRVDDFLIEVELVVGRKAFRKTDRKLRDKQVNTIQNNLPSLMIANVISTENAAQVKAEFNSLSTQVAAISPELIGAFGIPEELLSAPIARDWQEFNQYDNRGEVQAGVF